MPRPRPLRFLLLAVALVAAAAGARAQESEFETALRYGQEAMAAQKHEEAYRHLLFALARTPNPAPIARLLLENAAQDPDARALWAHDWLGFAADARGKATLLSRDLALLPADDPYPLGLTAARAAAARDLLAFRDKCARSRKSGDAILAEWCEDLSRRLAARSPALLNDLAASCTPELPVDRTVQHGTVDALQKLIRTAASQGDMSTLLRAGRALAGIANQAAKHEEVAGPEPPELPGAAEDAGDAIGRARAALAQKGRVWTLEELENMDEDEARMFTVEHASFGNPGVTHSPQSWYRVETGCGHGTLLGAAQTVEDHHQRLVNWYGQDPFVGQPGVLRIVNESFGLEMEGAPFWWAGGFQGGDTTTVKFTIGTIPGLGHLLTHELTHRFDGAIYPGIGAWMAEGRAVWTAGSYGKIVDRNFVDNLADGGTMMTVRNMGYGDPGKLAEIISGTNEEYRDNYPVGYALWVYLRSWSGPEEGTPKIFEPRLEEYMKACARSRKPALDLFLDHFADGKDGRPEDLETFAEEFAKFLDGWYWKAPAPWTARYNTVGVEGESGAVIYDEPTWTWQRARAEPWFGQDHARVAAEVLAAAGRDEDAVLAYRWSLAVDELPDADLTTLAAVLERARNPSAAWAVRRWARFDSPRRRNHAAEPAPFLKELKDLTTYLSQISAAAQAYGARGWWLAAAALTAEHDELAWSLGLPPLALAIPAETLERIGARETGLHPFETPSRWIGLEGFGESGLTGHEDRRVPHLWYVDARGDVHVGREEPRGGTDTIDRASHARDAFVHTLSWQDPGRYVVRAKVELTTAFVSGGLTVGWLRRDRNVRIGFAAGDWDFAAGESDERDATMNISWSIDGLYARGGGQGGVHGFNGADRTTFQVEARVDGPTLELYLDGELASAWTTLDGRPIQGHVGFYTGQGAVRVIAPEVQRLDRSLWSPAGGALGGGLHPQRRGGESLRDLKGRPVSGMPIFDSGTVAIWFAAETPERMAELKEGEWRARIAAALGEFLDHYEVESPSQGVTVILPEALSETDRASLQAEFTPRAPRGGLGWAVHQREQDLMESTWTVGGWTRPIVAFADPAGTLRWALPLRQSQVGLPRDLLTLLREYQDHARPGVAGAAD
jgi:hypothetical protein